MSQTFPAALSALGIQPSDIPTNTTAEQLLRRLLENSFFSQKVLLQFLEAHAASTVDHLHPLEIKKLREKLLPAKPQHQVVWTVGEGLTTGRLHVLAQCSHGRSFWDCPPDRLGNAKHCTESLPAHLRDAYTKRWAPVSLYSAAEAEILGRNALPSKCTK